MAKMNVNTADWKRCPYSNRKHSRDINVRKGKGLASLSTRMWLDNGEIVTEVLLTNSDHEGIGFEFDGHWSREAEDKVQELAASVDAVGFNATFIAQTQDV